MIEMEQYATFIASQVNHKQIKLAIRGKQAVKNEVVGRKATGEH